MTYTYQTRLELDETTSEVLDQYASLYGKVLHNLYADICKGHHPNSLKNAYLKAYGITARQFNACKVQIQGKIASIRELQKQQRASLQESIKHLKKKIPKIKSKQTAHQKKRKLAIKMGRLAKLEADIDQEKIHLCFGGKKRFRKQFALKENGYSSHKEWKSEWEDSRNTEIFMLGSKDETGGNQSCTPFIHEDQSLTIRLRLPNSFSQKYTTIPNIHFNYGHLAILASLLSCQERQQAKSDQKKHLGQAISFRLKKDKKGWRFFATTNLAPAKIISKEHLGAIGVDINANHLALAETDRYGNLIAHKTIPLNLKNKTQDQRLAIIGDASASIIQWTEQTQKPVILEKLNFQKKKASLKETSFKKHAPMLSSFAYDKIITSIKSRAYRHGIQVHTVNPAYTSVIGLIKFASRYGISKHHAAALCIARRHYKFSEKPPLSSTLPDGKNGQLTLTLPVRNRVEHVWTFWAKARKKIQTAFEKHFRTRNRSTDPPQDGQCDSHIVEITGAIPAR